MLPCEAQNTLKQDELRAAAGQCSERWRRPRVVRWWMRRLWSEFTDVPRIPFPLHGAFAVSSGESGPTQSTWSTAVCHHQAALIARGRYCSERPDWGPLPTMAAVSWPLTKAVDLVPFGRRNAVHRRRWHSLLGAGRSGRSNAEPETSDKQLHVTAAVRTEGSISNGPDTGAVARVASCLPALLRG